MANHNGDAEEALAGRLRLARVNAARARRFAQALGEEAKTDAVDARVLAAMGRALPLRQVEAKPQALRDLDELATARDGLVKDRVAALNRRTHVRDQLLRRRNRNRLAQIDRQLKALDARIGKLLAADPALARRAEVLASIPGLGPVTVAGLVVDMPELGRLDAKAAASLTGVAPMARESGNWKGRSHIKGGRARRPALDAQRGPPAQHAAAGSDRGRRRHFGRWRREPWRPQPRPEVPAASPGRLRQPPAERRPRPSAPNSRLNSARWNYWKHDQQRRLAQRPVAT